MQKRTNPFYGKNKFLELNQIGSKVFTPSQIKNVLDSAFSEIKNIEDRELFYSICFSICEIPDRTHYGISNIENLEKGGSGNVNFTNTFLDWLIRKDKQQFINFIPQIVDYISLKPFTTLQVTKEGNFKGILNIIMNDLEIRSIVIDLLADYVNSEDEFKHYLVAKFINVPDFTKRKRKNGKKTAIKPITKQKMNYYKTLLYELSEKVGWEISEFDNYIKFSGFVKWRKQFSSKLEFIEFSTKNILNYDKSSFINFINKLPSKARSRVRNMVKNESKWSNENLGLLNELYSQWENSKKEAQTQLRELKNKETLTKEDLIKISKLEKEAKVNIAGTTISDLLLDVAKGNAQEIVFEQLASQVKFDSEVLVVCDVSSSMGGMAINVAQLVASLVLYKNKTNPFFMRFASSCDYVYNEDNSVIDRNKSFYENYVKIKTQYIKASGGSTNISGLAEQFKSFVDSAKTEYIREKRIEMIKGYKTLLVISDGDLNNQLSAAKSIQDCIMKLKHWFGWEGKFVIWEVPNYTYAINKSSYFDIIENVLHETTLNANFINTLLTKIDEIRVTDIYASLEIIHKMNRYKPIRQAVL